MAFGERLAISISPLFLRLGLGVTFFWIGMGGFMAVIPVQGEDAAILANAGVLKPQWSTPPARPSAAPTTTTPPNPVVDEPPPAPSQPIPPSTPNDPEASGEPGEPPKEAPKILPAGRLGRPPRTVIASAPGSFTIQRAEFQPPGVIQPYTAKEFPEEAKVPRVHRVTLLLVKAATPNGAVDGAPSALLPPFVARGNWPVTLAYVAAVVATLGGAFLLVGLFTRLSSLAIAVIIGMAMWLTVLGPELQNGNTIYGVLPAYPRFDLASWQTPLWQLTLLTAALALFFAGPGGMSLDRLIFGRAKTQSKPAPAPRQS